MPTLDDGKIDTALIVHEVNIPETTYGLRDEWRIGWSTQERSMARTATELQPLPFGESQRRCLLLMMMPTEIFVCQGRFLNYLMDRLHLVSSVSLYATWTPCLHHRSPVSSSVFGHPERVLNRLAVAGLPFCITVHLSCCHSHQLTIGNWKLKIKNWMLPNYKLPIAIHIFHQTSARHK